MHLATELNYAWIAGTLVRKLRYSRRSIEKSDRGCVIHAEFRVMPVHRTSNRTIPTQIGAHSQFQLLDMMNIYGLGGAKRNHCFNYRMQADSTSKRFISVPHDGPFSPQRLRKRSQARFFTEGATKPLLALDRG